MNEGASTPAAGQARTVLRLALALALTSAVSLGLARFSYALILPPMRADLGWSYVLSGAMNTVNAAGYLAGALMCRRWLARFEARRLLAAGGAAAVLALLAHGLWVPADMGAGIAAEAGAAQVAGWHGAWLGLVRFLGGVASAAMFVAGGVLAARLANRAGSPAGRPRAGLVLGIYYGGTGLGIVLSSLLVPWVTHWATGHAWRWAWVGLGLLAALAQLATSQLLATGASADLLAAVAAPRPTGGTASGAPPPKNDFPWRRFGPSLAGYFCFGLGYIGYMTFVITLLREQRLSSGLVTAFFALLGVGVTASSALWAGLLQRHRGGRPMAQLNALVALATVLPVVSFHPVAVLASGLLFGCVFLSVVASTTALVRHNLPESLWTPGIAAYTVVFAVGQILGPVLVGWVADGPGGLLRGFGVSGAVLALGAGVAWRQKALSGP